MTDGPITPEAISSYTRVRPATWLTPRKLEQTYQAYGLPYVTRQGEVHPARNRAERRRAKYYQPVRPPKR